MKPHKTLKIKMCKKCGSTNIQFDFYFKAKMEGINNFLWESKGFLIKPKCGDCDFEGMRYYETTEDAIRGWND